MLIFIVCTNDLRTQKGFKVENCESYLAKRGIHLAVPTYPFDYFTFFNNPIFLRKTVF